MRGRHARTLRIGILLAVLVGVLLYAWDDVRRRRARNEWQYTLQVAIVLLEEQPVDPRALTLLKDRVAAVEAQLAAEQRRYREGAPPPFHFEVFGPASVSRPTPERSGESIFALLRSTWAMRSWVRAVDSALDLDASDFDARVYANLRPSLALQPTHVEGQSEHGGRIAQVRVELDSASVDLAWIVMTHELLHTLGATDKYDAVGRALNPEGFADPLQSPLYPQQRVEVMARNRPIEAGVETVPTMISELGVGPVTASEIGWSMRP